MASAVSANRCMSSFSLHQNLEPFAHASGKDESFNLYEALHGCGVTGIRELGDFVKDAKTNEVIHLSRKADRFERSLNAFIDQVGKVNVCRHILIPDPDIGILYRLVMPIAHQRATRLSVKLIAEVAVLEGRRNSPDPMTRLQIDISDLTLLERRLNRFLQLAFYFFEILIHVNLFQHTSAMHHSM